MARPRGKPAKTTAARVSVEHVREPAFRMVFSDGALVRSSSDVQYISMTFYFDDQKIISESGKIAQETREARVFTIDSKEEEQRRVHQVEVRLPTSAAMSLARLIVDKLPEDMIRNEISTHAKKNG